jgi:hypothetical protein
MPAPELLRQFIRECLTQVPERSRGDEVCVICPEPACGDQSGNRHVNLKSGLTGCYRCNRGGPVANWAKRLGLTFDFGTWTPAAVGMDQLAVLTASLDGLAEGPSRRSGYIPEVELPRGFTALRDEPDSAYARLIGKMAERKRLTLDVLTEAGVGFTREDRRWEPFAIFPVFEYRRPVYFQGRTYQDPKDGGSTKQFPTRTECPLSSRYWIYGADEVAAQGGVVIFVEAILNVLSLRLALARRGVTGVVPAAVFKHKLSLEQVQKVMATGRRARQGGHPVTEFCFMYDGRTSDEVRRGLPGDAARAARLDAARLAATAPVTIVDLPDRVDPNDDADLAVDLFLRRRRWDRQSDLSSLVQV